jgi:hypothetical protein
MYSRLARTYTRFSRSFANRILNPVEEIGDIILFTGEMIRTIPRSGSPWLGKAK